MRWHLFALSTEFDLKPKGAAAAAAAAAKAVVVVVVVGDSG